MARQPRPVHTERLYHVFSRGNYRAPIFAEAGACEAFLQAIDETLAIHDWEIYAFAIMPNHFHVCFRTPNGDLSEGMHRLLTAFAVRFNRFRKEGGHVFQGRFKATVAPRGIAARRIIDYIHLNPARANLCDVETTSLLPTNSLRAYLCPQFRGRLAIRQAFERFVGFPDTEDGRRGYLAELKVLHGKDPRGADFREELMASDKAERRERRAIAEGIAPERLRTRAEVATERRARWEHLAKELLAAAGLSERDLAEMAKFHPAKIAIARDLRARCGATCTWIAQRLQAGTADSLRARLSEQRGQAARAVKSARTA